VNRATCVAQAQLKSLHEFVELGSEESSEEEEEDGKAGAEDEEVRGR
jgi:hypothetical protein